MSPEPTTSPSRWLALDVFRALAVLWMIQGHTFTALLSTPDVFAGGLGQLYRVLHGLTAPMFLCGAGLAYGIVRFNAARPAAPGRMWRRALLLLAIGVTLQLPAAPLSDILHDRALLSGTLRPGALQLVAACLMLAELLRSASSARPRRFAVLCACAAVLCALCAPWLWGLELSSRFVLGSWLDGHSGAQFPAVPWISFFLCGAALASFWGARLWRERWLMPLVGCVGLAASALCYGQFLSGQRLHALYGEHPFWFSNPMFVVFRAGLVLAWLALLSGASSLLARGFATWPLLARVISALSRHSLVAYVVHLSMLYGLPVLRGQDGVHEHYSLLGCSLVCSIVLAVSVLAVLHWERLRTLLSSVLRAWTKPLSPQLAQRGAAPRDPLV